MNSSNSTDTRYCEQELRLSTYTRDINSVTQPFVLEYFLDSSIPVTMRSKALRLKALDSWNRGFDSC
jgi:hypothetical protein